MNQEFERATLSGGCFWCIEALFKRLKGVISVQSGYAGSGEPSPSYEEVSKGSTDYTEAVQIKFNPGIISYEKILEVFWAMHNPTTLNRQGNDIGPQYRSVIFYHNDKQRAMAEKSKERLASSRKYKELIVTNVEPFTNFYPAETYHQNYYEQNRNSNSYCQLVIDPKVRQLYRDFKAELKPEYSDGEI